MTAPAAVALDISALQVDGVPDRGIGRYVSAYSAALARSGRVEAALLIPELPPPSNLPGELISAGLVGWDSLPTARRLLAADRPVVHHVTAPFLHCSMRDAPCLGVAEHWAASGVPRVVTVYDLIPLRDPDYYLTEPGYEERYRARAEWVAQADLLLAISEHTRSEIIEVLGCDPSKVVVAGAGVSAFFSPPDGTDEPLWRFHLGAFEGRTYLLTVGGADPRKNTERLIAAVGLLARRGLDLGLAVVGDIAGDWARPLLEAAEMAGIADRVVLTGPISDEALRACYRMATLTVMPSLSEGYGLPVLESAACSTPALASSTTSLAEVAATPLATFDPVSTESIACCIEAALLDEGRRQAILAAQRELVRQSTWDAVAERAMAAIDATIRPVGGTATRAPARRMALVGPFPPDGGGIGQYDRRLADAMPADVWFDAVGAGGQVDVPPATGRVSAPSFGVDVRPSSFDGVVYVLGNSAGHLHTVELALRYPGWLWLHEARLPAIATTALAALDDERFEAGMARLLRRAYPGRAPIGAASRAGRSVLELVAAGVGLLAPLAEASRGILVNSQVARRLVHLDLRPLGHHPPVIVLPPACPPLLPGAAQPRHISTTADALVVALGVVSMSKRPDMLVDAAAAAGCRLAFVGACVPILAQVIRERAQSRGIPDRVEVVGEVDPEKWERWVRDADLAVQLRDSVSGETSAAVLEALSSGVPVVTNIASAAEWPHGTVRMVASTDASSVADAVTSLVLDRGARVALRDAGRSFAADHQFDRLARELLRIATSEDPNEWPA